VVGGAQTNPASKPVRQFIVAPQHVVAKVHLGAAVLGESTRCQQQRCFPAGCEHPAGCHVLDAPGTITHQTKFGDR
jgi:hypothetical protein